MNLYMFSLVKLFNYSSKYPNFSRFFNFKSMISKSLISFSGALVLSNIVQYFLSSSAFYRL